VGWAGLEFDIACTVLMDCVIGDGGWGARILGFVDLWIRVWLEDLFYGACEVSGLGDFCG